MKKILLLTLLTGATLAAQPTAPAPAPVAPPSKESIDKLVGLEHVDRIHDKILAQIDQGTAGRVRQALRGQPATPADEAVIADLHQQVVTAVEGVLSPDKLKAVWEKTYSEVYTQEEVDGLIAFYNTPVGQVFAEKQPEIAQKNNKLMQQTMLPMIMKIQSATEAAARKLMTAHAPPRPAAPAAATPAAAPAPATPPATP